jgi:aminopeptidase N
MRRFSWVRLGLGTTAGVVAARLAAVIATAVVSLSLVVLAAGCGGILGSEGTTSTQVSATQQPVTTMAPGGESGSPGTTPSTGEPPTGQPPTTLSSAGIAVHTGSSEGGDPYFPSSGNGGYDVQHYAITLDIDPESGRIAGETTVDAIATQELAAFYLDLLGLEVSAVEVDGNTAEFKREGQELKIICPAMVAAGSRFSVKVSYAGVPTPLNGKQFAVGWQKVGDIIYTLDEPQGAACWFPVNDMPADKATYEFRLTVPEAYTATASGRLVGNEATGTPGGEATHTYWWQMDKPMASYLAAVTVDRYVAEERPESRTGVAMRDYYAVDLAPAAQKAFSRTAEVVDYFSGLFGPYPFEEYGVVVPDVDIGAAMENQTLSLFGRDVLTKRMSDPVAGPLFLSHELAHQWFGNSVTIEQWDDVWLNEGFATYASWLWLEHELGSEALETIVRQTQDTVSKSIEPPPGEPGNAHLFGVSTYLRGGLTLHALRLTVGDDTFFRILRTWTERYKYGNADTADFVALVKEEAGQGSSAEIAALLEAWLYGQEMPELPAAP